MTSERKINWEAPVVGRLVDGKTYVDRKGDKHLVSRDRMSNEGRLWFQEGDYLDQHEGEAKHVLDLIAEYTPPKPLKMWMNTYNGGDSAAVHPSEARAREIATGLNAIRIAVPVTITEGHGDD